MKVSKTDCHFISFVHLLNMFLMLKTVNALSIERHYYIVLLTAHQYRTCWCCSICSCFFLLLPYIWSLIQIFNRKLRVHRHTHTHTETDKIRNGKKYLVAFVHSVSIKYYLNFYLETSDDSSIYITTEKPKTLRHIVTVQQTNQIE